MEYNETIGTLPQMCVRLIRAIDSGSVTLGFQGLEIVAEGILTNETTSLIARLRGFRAEPYFTKAQEFIQSMTPLRDLWLQRDDQALNRQLTEQLRRLELWKREVGEQRTGINFGKYALS